MLPREMSVVAPVQVNFPRNLRQRNLRGRVSVRTAFRAAIRRCPEGRLFCWPDLPMSCDVGGGAQNSALKQPHKLRPALHASLNRTWPSGGGTADRLNNCVAHGGLPVQVDENSVVARSSTE